jgi:hypothetical protein
MPEIMAALTSGKLDGAMLLSVYAFQGKELGYHELLDLGSLDVQFPQGVTLTTRSEAKRFPKSPHADRIA